MIDKAALPGPGVAVFLTEDRGRFEDGEIGRDGVEYIRWECC